MPLWGGHTYPREHASAIMPLQRRSEDRIWSVTFLSKLRYKRSWWTMSELVPNVNNCVDTFLRGESKRLWTKCQKGAETQIQISLIIIQSINAVRNITVFFSVWGNGISILSCQTSRDWKAVDQNRLGPNTDNVWAELLEQTFSCIVSEDSDLLAVL